MMDLLAVPFGYLMRFCHMLTGNYAVALILFTLAFKLILLPLSIRQHKSSVKQAKLRPKERAIRKRYEGRTDPEARIQLATELQNMYKEEKYSVAGGCLPLLIQLPIIIVLYRIVQQPLTYISALTAETVNAIQTRILESVRAGILTVNGLTAESTAVSQIQMTGVLRANPELFLEWVPEGTLLPDFMLFGAIDLSANPSFASFFLLIIPVLAGAFPWLSAFVSRKLMPQPERTAETESVDKTMNMMNIVMPITTVIIAFGLPTVMGLYWVYQSIFGIITQVILYKTMPIPTYTEEEYLAVEAEMNRDYVPIPAPAARSAHSLHRIDEDDEAEDGELPYEDLSDSEDEEDAERETPHRGESAPRVRYDKNGNPIRSLHYIDFDEDDSSDDADTDSKNGE